MTREIGKRLLLTVTTGFSAHVLAQNPPIDEVLVQGSRYISEVSVAGKVPLSRREIPASVSVLTAQRLEDQNLTTLAEGLAQVTGVTIVPNDGLQSQYRSRGYALSVMNDGVPSYLALSGYQQFDAAIYDRIEVIRGPNGILTGVADPAGAVNLVTKRGRDDFAINATAGIGSWDNFRTTVDIGGPLAGAASLRGRLVGVFEDRGHFSGGLETQRRAGHARIDGAITASTSWSASVTAQDDRQEGAYSGLPAFVSGPFLQVPRTTSVAQDWSRTRWTTVEAAVGISQQLTENWSVILRGSQREQSHSSHDAYPIDGVRESDMTLPFGRRQSDYTYSRAGVDVFAAGTVPLLGREHSLVVGFNFDRFDQDFAGVSRTSVAQAIRVPLGDPSLVPPLSLPYEQGSETQREQRGFYAQFRANLSDRLTMVAGARSSDFEARTRSASPSPSTAWRRLDNENNEVSPMAGLAFDVTRSISLYASYAETFLPQSTLLKIGGESLDPRVGRQFEAGLKSEWYGGALQGSLAAFDLRDVGRSLADPVNPGYFVNAGEVESKGWEAELVGSPAANYEIQLGYSRLNARFLAGTAAQTGQRFSIQEPRHSWRFWAMRRLPDGASRGLTLGLGASAQSGIEDEPRVQGGYAIANALVSYRLNSSVTVALNANNLFDKVHYTRIGGVNIYNTFGTPRNVALTLRASF